MAVAATQYSNAWGLAKALQQVAQKRGPRLELIPFNQFEPASTTWWLSPHPNPAYKSGKIGITDKGIEPEIIVGLYIEKGVGRSAASAFTTAKDRRLLMRDDWIWHRFASALTDGEIAETCARAGSRVGANMTVAIDAQAISPSEAWYQSRYGMPRDFACFFADDGQLKLDFCELSARVAPGLAEIASLSDVPALVATADKSDWIWFDIHIGYRLALEYAADMQSWDSDAIWEAACAPWDDWIVP
jgi:hypothetical protein